MTTLAATLIVDLPADFDLVEEEIVRPADRAPGMPLMGFLVGLVLSVPLWGAIGLGVWAFIN